MVDSPKSPDEQNFVSKHVIRLFDYPVKNNGIFTARSPAEPHNRLADNDLSQAIFTYESLENSKDCLKEEFGTKWRAIAGILAKKHSPILESLILEQSFVFKAGKFKHSDGSSTSLSKGDVDALNEMFGEVTDKKSMWNLAISSKQELNDMIKFAKTQQS